MLKDTEDPPLIESMDDLEGFIESLNVTVQITYRVRLDPPWLVRMARIGYPKLTYRQAVGDSISEAMEACYEAWAKDEEAPKAGRKPNTDLTP